MDYSQLVTGHHWDMEGSEGFLGSLGIPLTGTTA